MPSGLIALLDHVAGIAKMAAASIDDVGAAAGKASTKAAGVVVDDAAVTPRYVTGLSPSRELPIIGKIALGSFRNKLIFILPAALLLSAFAPWAITPLLMCGGAYLCFEGAEKLMEAFGLAVATTQIVDFGKRRVLVVERFDRRWRDADHLVRLPQEDFCQALSAPSSRKYQNQGGPSPQQILARLGESDDPHTDRLAFFKSLIIFWLIGATDGHAKNFSLFLRPGGRFQMTPLYDVLSAQPAFDAKRIPHKSYTLAMSAGAQPHYKILDVMGRHFIEMAEAADLGPTLVRQALTELLELADSAADTALAQMPADFHEPIHASIRGAISASLPRLATALDTI